MFFGFSLNIAVKVVKISENGGIFTKNGMKMIVSKYC